VVVVVHGGGGGVHHRTVLCVGDGRFPRHLLIRVELALVVAAVVAIRIGLVVRVWVGTAQVVVQPETAVSSLHAGKGIGC
jgi:hypothetical protein